MESICNFNRDKLFSAILCVEFPQVQCITFNSSEIVVVVKAVVIVQCTLRLINLPLWSVTFGVLMCPRNVGTCKLGFGTQKKTLFFLNRGCVPSIEVTDIKIMKIHVTSWTKFCVL